MHRPESVQRSMLSLRQILAQHSPVLLIDSSSSLIQVGLLFAERAPVWEAIEGEASVGVFSAAERLLVGASLTISSINAFIFCAGPGSVLGVRTAAVALRTWNAIGERPIFSYASLELVVHFQLQARSGSIFSVIADARRDTWHQIAVQADGAVGALRRVNATALSGELIMPLHFRHWATPPENVVRVPYNVAEMFAVLPDAALFSVTSEPDAFLHETPTYVTWTPEIHRAP